MISGGKDSIAALMHLMRDPSWRVERLITTSNETNRRIALHGTPIELLRRQAAAVGLPLTEIPLPENCDNDTYLARVAQVLEPMRAAGLQHVAFGDLYLADVREFRENQMGALDMSAVFPLWGADTTALAHRLIDEGLEARLCCVDLEVLPADLLGRTWDRDLLAGLPDGVDRCGENGEFHTFVVAAPIMDARIGVSAHGTHVSHGRFCMLDLRPA